MAKALYFPHPFDLSQRTVLEVQDGITVQAWLERSGFAATLRERPTVVVLNGVELLEEEYNTVLQASDIVALTTLPEGAFLPAIGAWLASNWVAVSLFLVSAALTLYGMQEPTLGEGAGQESPNHNLSVRQNRARLGQPIPVLYGTARCYPDLSSQPFTQFDADGDQVAFLLFELTQGHADVDTSSARFEDTLLSEFADASIEVIPPGSRSTLFPADVNVSSSVENLELTDAGLGPFAANPPATEISSVAFDVVAPQGLFRQRSSGNLDRRPVHFHFERREIDDEGDPLGDWVSLGPLSLSGAGSEAIRRTFRYTLTPGRYEFRMVRDTPEAGAPKISDLVQWAQMRAYYADGLPVTNTTRIAVRIRATEQIGSRALTQFNIVATRKLHTWSSSTGWSDSPVATNSPAWAFADACRAEYGGRRADAYIDLVGLESLATTFANQGFECNGIFDTQMSLWDALVRICQTAQCMPVDRAGVYRMVQDKASTEHVQLFNMRNIVRDSFATDHAGVLEETADHVVVQFYDKAQDYRLTSLPCVLPGGTSNKPREVKLWGVTDAEQAWEIGMRLAAANRYRRRAVSFETGLEGRIPGYMDVIRVSHFQLGAQGAAQLSGDVIAYDGVDTITVTESLTGKFTTPYVVLHNLQGEPLGAYQCTVIADRTIRIDEEFDDSGLVFQAGYARPRFQIGEGSNFDQLVKVTKVSRTGQHQYRIEGFVDNPAVYTITDGEIPPEPEELAALKSRVPTVSRLVARGLGKPSEPVVLLTWEGTNADRYIVEYSTDGQSTWQEAGRTREPRFYDQPAFQGAMHYRVVGLSIFRGQPAVIAVNTTTIVQESTWVPFDAPISVRASASNGFSWVFDPLEEAWSPSGTTTDITFTFVRLGDEIAEHVVRFTLDPDTGLITAATEGTPSGDDTTLYLTNNGGATVVATIVHDESGEQANQTVFSLIGGAPGAPGDPGSPGDSVDIIFRRSATQPSTPGASAGVPAGWYSDVASVPAADDPLWSSVGVKAGGATNYTWNVPVKIEADDGEDGEDGLSIAELTIFRRGSSAPSTPTGGSFNFGTGVLTPPSGWSSTVPSGTDPVYTSRAVAAVTGSTGTDSSLTWSTPVLSFQNGADGATGATGPRAQVGLVYYQLTSELAPDKPTASNFNFSTGAFTDLTENWSTAAPVFEAANPNRYWYAYYRVVETAFGGSVSITFTDPQTAMHFAGLVTFTGDNVITDGDNELSFGPSGTTTINGGNITTGTIKADRLQVGALPGGENLIANPGAETNSFSPHSASNGGGTWSITSTLARSGTYAFFYNPLGQTTAAFLHFNGAAGDVDRAIPCSDGDEISFSVWVRASLSGTTANTVSVQLRFTQANGDFDSAPSETASLTPGTFVKVTVTATAPATAAYVTPRIQIASEGGDKSFVFDDALCTRNRGALAALNQLPINLLLGGTFADFIEIGAGGKIYSGKSAFDANASGWFLGLDSGTPVFRIGNADNSKSLTYDGTDLRLLGGIISGEFVNLVGTTITAFNAGGFSTYIAELEINADGTVYSVSGDASLPSRVFLGTWLFGGQASDYTVEVTTISGTLDSGTLTPQSLGSDREWRVSQPGAGGDQTFVGLWTIKKDGVAVAAAQFTLQVLVVE